MESMLDTAIEAIVARDQRSPLYRQYLEELEARCSSAKVQELLARARAIVPNPADVERALRILRRSAKAARRRESQRSEELRAVACSLVGREEVDALIEEHRLCFTPEQTFEETPSRYVRSGFVILAG